MTRKLFALFFVFMVMSLFALSQSSGSLSSAGKKEQVQDGIKNRLVIGHTEIFGKLERPQVIFDHGRHTDALKKEGCRTCHPHGSGEDYLFDFPFRTEKKSAQQIQDLYHEKCITCHRKVIREKRKSLPIRCGDCHIKKFESLALNYPPVEFDYAVHDKHVKKLREEKVKDECSACHHTYDPREEDESLRLFYEKGREDSCSYCHDLRRKRGPGLSVIVAAAAKKGLSLQKASHLQCVNCHLRRTDTGAKAGPVECMECHTGKCRTTAELANVPRPERDQPKKPFLFAEKANMKGVLFDHAFHEKNSKTCRACHHETMQACGKCHGIVGSQEGGWINLTNAFHDPGTDIGCIGCHKAKKKGKDCAGCHYHMADMDVQAKGPKKAVCTVCHSGKKDGSVSPRPLPQSALDPKKVPEKVTIKILEEQYEPATFPHLKIIRKLIDISNESKVGTAFHLNLKTICNGCHHQSIDKAEVRETEPPFCRNCHSVTFDAKNMNRPRLLAVYHRQCMGCHEKMGIKERGCTDCHKKKPVQPKNLLSETGNIATLFKGGS